MQEDDFDFLRRISSIVHRASGELSPKFFSIEEASKLNDESAKLWRNASWLRLVFGEMSAALIDIDHPSRRDPAALEAAFLDCIEAAYLIGADTNFGTSQQKYSEHQLTARMRPKRKAALSEADLQTRIEALQFARSKPLSKPLGKSQGTTALAGRLLPQFNAYLKSAGLDAVSQDVVEKLLRKYPPA